MMRQWCVGVLYMAVCSTTGCAPHLLGHSAWAEPRPLGERLQAYRPPTEPERPETDQAVEHQDPTGELTLRGAMTLALARSSTLRAFGWDVRAAQAKAAGAGLWPNPELEAEFENFGGSGGFAGSQSLETTISLAQTFPLGRDIERRLELAGYESQLAGWDYEAARLDLLTQVTQRYVAVLARQRQLETARQAHTLAQQIRQTTSKRIEAGDAPQIELARASVPVAVASVELRRAQRSLESAKLHLAMTWGQTQITFSGLQGDFERLDPLPSPAALVALINQNPQVARWATQISARRAEIRLAQAQAVSDVTGRIGYRYENSEHDSGLVAGVSLPLPIFDRRQGDVLAARLSVASAQQRRREVELRLEAMLSQAYARLTDAHDEAVALRDEALAPAQEAFDVTRQAFEKGDLGFLDVIHAERTLIALRSRYVDVLAAYHEAVAQIEGLIGQPMPATNAQPARHESAEYGDESP